LTFPEKVEEIQGKRYNQYLYDRWLQIVENYCIYRRLTICSDKLPALEGIRHEFQKHLNGDYILGLWKGDFLRGLPWYTERLETSRLVRHADQAPSWSWARWDGNTKFPIKILKDISDKTSVEILACESNIYGLQDPKDTGGHSQYEAGRCKNPWNKS
jgi:hypothetical protein